MGIAEVVGALGELPGRQGTARDVTDRLSQRNTLRAPCVSTVSSVLRRLADRGYVEQAGTIPGSGRSVIVWRLPGDR
jgi:hypothetical protein